MKRVHRNNDLINEVEVTQWKDITQTEDTLYKRKNQNKALLFISIFITICVICVIWGRLYYLQIIKGGDFLKRSKENYIAKTEITPNRGVIYDRKGYKLAENNVGYKLYMRTYLVNEEVLKSEISQYSSVLNVKYDDLWDLYLKNKENKQIFEVSVLGEVNRDDMLILKQKNLNSVYFRLQETPIRVYNFGEETSHFVGYTAEATSDEISIDSTLRKGDIVGRDGVEYSYNELLKGIKGEEYFEVDAQNNIINNYSFINKKPIDGASVYLTVDYDLQLQSYNLLKDKINSIGATGGAITVMDVNTGEVLVLTNYPSYNSNLFIGGITNEEIETYNALVNSTQNPFMNRVISESQPPGSTFKLVVALSLLDVGSINANTIHNSTGVIYIGNDRLPIQEYGKKSYGLLTPEKAICKSSNIFFCESMIDFNNISKFDEYAKTFGIGEKTGIKLPGEASGILPSPENKALLAEYNPYLDPYWYPEGDNCLTGFGQGITTITPIQLTVISAAISNGGKIIEPKVVNKYTQDGKDYNVETIYKNQQVVSNSALSIVRSGMECSTTSEGVISSMASAPVKVAAKTGTAEFGTKNSQGIYEHTHAWITGYFPANNPKYSFTVLLEDGKSSTNASLLMRDIIKYMVDKGYY